MRNVILFVFLIVFSAVLVVPMAQAEESSAQYSAVEKMSTPGGDMESRVFVMPGMKRMEMKDATQILRFDKGVMWMLMSKEKMYMERPISTSPGGSSNLKYLEKKKIGKESINGVMATKYKTVAKDPQGNKLDGLSWLTDQGILVKNDMQVQDGSKKSQIKSELSELKIGKQDPSLFEVPKGFKMFSMPTGMPTGMPGG